MALFAISDLHLSFGCHKPMDVFGSGWADYHRRIEAGWRAAVTPLDTVVLPGDFCWGISLEQCLPDFQFLHSLPGRKILGKGNHDYYFSTVSKVMSFLRENSLTSIDFLHNNAFLCDGVAIAGTKGWFYEEEKGTEHDEKIFKRECIRLEVSLQAARGLSDTVYAFLHYPPIFGKYRCEEVLALLAQYGVSKCLYGHLHSSARYQAFEGTADGIAYYLISADHLDFAPLRLS